MKATTTLGIFALAVATSACGGKSKGSDEPAPIAAAPAEAMVAEPAPVPTGPGMGLGVEAARAKSTFAMFPKGADVVAGVSLAQLRQAPVWARVQQLVGSRLDAQLAIFRDTCNMDPISHVDSVEIGGQLAAEDMVLLVAGKFTRAAVAECGKSIAAKNGKTVAIADEGALTSYTDGGDVMWIGWPNDSQALVADPDKHDKAWMADRVAGRGSMRENDAFIGLVGNVDTNATAWMAVHDTTGQFAMAAQFLGGAAPQGVYASLRVTEEAKGEIGFQFASEQDADAAATALGAFVDQAKQDPSMGSILSDVTAKAYGNNAVIEINLNKEQFEQLIAMLISMAPMLGI